MGIEYDLLDLDAGRAMIEALREMLGLAPLYREERERPQPQHVLTIGDGCSRTPNWGGAQ